jgi:hypothetical protein
MAECRRCGSAIVPDRLTVIAGGQEYCSWDCALGHTPRRCPRCHLATPLMLNQAGKAYCLNCNHILDEET